mmetsp:Transcript_78999/g.154967  ORF Transcript_78999/g.154967 Transcript_78999/m.154967 type:complete len:119 (+) Transcript_78999:27-383(+)
MLSRLSKMLLLLFVSVILSPAFSEVMCFEKGSCAPCKKEDSTADYCKPTGRMIRLICNDGEHQYEELRACPLTAEDEQIRVIIFQVAMCLIGGLTYWAAQRRKMSTLTLFDSRRFSRR